MQQEIFSFKKTERLDWGDFIESDENRLALAHLMKWPCWENEVAVIHGESGVGKTHLAGLWAQTANAVYVLMESLNHNPRDLFNADCNFVIDNFDDVLRTRNYDWIFHFLNIAKEKKRYVLILSREKPSLWDVNLDDLKSRLIVLPATCIENPRDELLFEISKKIAKDLGVFIPDDALLYMLNVIDRKVTALSETLKAIDKISLRQKKPITLNFVRIYLKKTKSQDFSDEPQT